MEATEARRGYARVAAWDEGNLIQAMAREIEKQRASSCRGRACTVAICQSTRPLSRWLVPSGMPWCCVLPYIRVKHASWFRALACVCPQTSPRRALSSLCVAVCRESVVSRDSRFVCAHGCRSSDGCGSQNC